MNATKEEPGTEWKPDKAEVKRAIDGFFSKIGHLDPRKTMVLSDNGATVIEEGEGFTELESYNRAVNKRAIGPFTELESLTEADEGSTGHIFLAKGRGVGEVVLKFIRYKEHIQFLKEEASNLSKLGYRKNLIKMYSFNSNDGWLAFERLTQPIDDYLRSEKEKRNKELSKNIEFLSKRIDQLNGDESLKISQENNLNELDERVKQYKDVLEDRLIPLEVSGVQHSRVLAMLVGCLRALERCEECKIAHRDIKGENIMYRENTDDAGLVPKLFDFGASLDLVSKERELRSKPIRLMGTVYYMLRGVLEDCYWWEKKNREGKNPPISELAETFAWGDRAALGLTTYTLLTGVMPYHIKIKVGYENAIRKAGSGMEDWLRAVIRWKNSPVDLDELVNRTDVPHAPQFAEAIGMLLEKDMKLKQVYSYLERNFYKEFSYLFKGNSISGKTARVNINDTLSVFRNDAKK